MIPNGRPASSNPHMKVGRLGQLVHGPTCGLRHGCRRQPAVDSLVFFFAVLRGDSTEVLLFIGAFFYVAFVGTLVVPTVCAIQWIFRLPHFPHAQSGLAGAATGLACVCATFPSWVAVIASMVGGTAAFAGADIFIRRSAIAGPIREAIRLQELGSRHSRSLTISDLFGRITVAGILIAAWMKTLTNR